ncbi:hypothetical protein F53441_5725 [Fusarium austroafricanum]|uniref:Uncharacterized protein n=1 Tax=Fusarium austroafricanum TaxID=2364996 RepID=A0A8H4NU47_9HYPO|nr:hypothetical protein F53441_5725 [Fusarium austroafricanum]
MQLRTPNIFVRFQRVGILSVAALFLGGAILAFSGLNCLVGPPPGDDGLRLFLYGSHLSVQAWIAILGIGLGFLSFGFNESYIHLFDYYCGRQAKSDGGLDYTKYLNSQPRAPLLYGRRGFPYFITLRYLLTLASIAASIGYKFGVAKTEVSFSRLLDEDSLQISSLYFGSVGERNDSPWLTDDPARGEANKAFFHEDGEPGDPPKSIIMAGLLDCINSTAIKNGYLISREIVIVANMTVEDAEGYVMSRIPLGTKRAFSTAEEWLDLGSLPDYDYNKPNKSEIAIDFAMDRADQVFIEWAKTDPWDHDYSATLPVARRITYKMHYAVAEVTRGISGGLCDWKLDSRDSIQILSHDKAFPLKNAIDPVNTVYLDWASPVISTWAGSARSGVSSIVQIAMTIFLTNLDKSPFHFVSPDSHPFGPEVASSNQWKTGQAHHPYLQTFDGSVAVGCWISAAVVFVTAGLFSMIVGIIRLYIGPPALTSWMGQHIFLAREGFVSFSLDLQTMASGYEAAKPGLGKLHLE